MARRKARTNGEDGNATISAGADPCTDKREPAKQSQHKTCPGCGTERGVGITGR